MRKERNIWIYSFILMGTLFLLTNSCKKGENTTCTCMRRGWTSSDGYSSWTSVQNTECNRYCVPSDGILTTNIVYDGVGNRKMFLEYRLENCGNNIYNPPDSPVLVSPTNSSNTTTTVTLNWSCNNPDGNSLKYRVYLGQTNPPYYASETSNTSFTQDGLKNATTYYWKIVAENCAGTSNPSSIWSFTTGIGIPTVTTASISCITLNSSVGGGNVTSDGGAVVTERGVCWSTGQNPTIADNKTTDGSGIGSFTSYLTGLSNFTTFYARAYAINSVGTGYGNTISFTVYFGTVTDIDGNVYETIAIGTQIWMAENLRTTRYSNGEAIPNVTDATWSNLTTGAYCNYSNDTSNSTTYGRLYNWYSVKDSRNISPPGWHVPSDAEWRTLTTYLGGESVAGGKMKEIGTTHWQSPNTGATNETGFTALPGGCRDKYYSIDYNYLDLGDIGYWWTTTEYNDWLAWDRSLNYDRSVVGRYNGNKEKGKSVRCIKD